MKVSASAFAGARQLGQLLCTASHCGVGGGCGGGGWGSGVGCVSGACEGEILWVWGGVGQGEGGLGAWESGMFGGKEGFSGWGDGDAGSVVA